MPLSGIPFLLLFFYLILQV